MHLTGKEIIMRNIIPILLILLFSMPATAETLTVPQPFSTIQSAVDSAQSGDTVLVAEGTYLENVTIQSKSIVLSSHYLMDGDTSHISKTVINGSQPVNTDNATTVSILFCPAETRLCGFTITGGFGTKVINGFGQTQRVMGGVGVFASDALIDNNKISDNIIDPTTVPDEYSRAFSGGIGIQQGPVQSISVILRDNSISNNKIESSFTAGAGIGADCDSGKVLDLIIENNRIENNSVINTDGWKATGGGLQLGLTIPTKGEQIIRNNLFRGNRVEDTHSFGGAIYISINETHSEGMVDPHPGPFIYNNIIEGNHSDYLGGAIGIWRFHWPTSLPAPERLGSIGKYVPKPSIINNTIVNNTAKDGSGVFIENHIPFLMNNILWNEYPDSAEWGEIYLGDEPYWLSVREPNTYGGLVMHYCDVQGNAVWEGDHNLNRPPLFEDVLFNLSNGSPCVGHGADSIKVDEIWYKRPLTDFFGNPRPNPVDDFTDIGAIESPYLQTLPDYIPINEISKTSVFQLYQNYPNPFNPYTIIRYTLPVACHLDLSIYNLLGQKVTALVSEKQQAGQYQVQWDASGFPSGIYYYILKTNDFWQARKMILLH
jgi:hypothetical protein